MAENGKPLPSPSDQNKPSYEALQKQGWLMKRSKTSKKWKKQWCSLKKDFLFYGDLAESTSKKKIPLEGCELADCSVDKKLHAFRIKPQNSKRVYFFHSESEQDQQEWMQAICFAKATGNATEDGSQACMLQ